MKGKHLVHRTIAPRVSGPLDEVYSLLKMATPEVKNFTILIRDNGGEIQTRIIPMSDKCMADIFEVSENSVKYIAHTDEDNNFVRGEEV